MFSFGQLSQADSDLKTAWRHYEQSRQIFVELGRREDERRVEARQEDEGPERGSGRLPSPPRPGRR